MQKSECVKLFTGGDVGVIEKEYNAWHHEMAKIRKGHAAISNMPFVVFDRKLVIRQYKGEETFALAIFYEDYTLEEHEQGSVDRAGHVNGASMFKTR